VGGGGSEGISAKYPSDNWDEIVLLMILFREKYNTIPPTAISKITTNSEIMQVLRPRRFGFACSAIGAELVVSSALV
jgi:hypothetical protein